MFSPKETRPKRGRDKRGCLFHLDVKGWVWKNTYASALLDVNKPDWSFENRISPRLAAHTGWRLAHKDTDNQPRCCLPTPAPPSTLQKESVLAFLSRYKTAFHWSAGIARSMPKQEIRNATARRTTTNITPSVSGERALSLTSATCTYVRQQLVELKRGGGHHEG